MNSIFNIVQEIPVSTGKVYRTEDNLIGFDPHEGLKTQTLKEMKEIEFAFETVLNGEQLPYIVDISSAIEFGTKEKNYVREGLKMFSSVAFVTDKSISKVLLSVFLLFHRKSPIIKVFFTLKEAKKWSLDNHPLNNN